MRSKVVIRIFLSCAITLISRGARAENWPRFRGPGGQGESAETQLPVEWSNSQHVAWKTAIPGAGWSSPIVWNNRIFLTSALDGGTSCHVMALDRDSGALLWNVEVFKQSPTRKEGRNSYATPTPTTDGQRVYVFFGEGGAAALNFDGHVDWINIENNYYSQHGMGASPILYKDTLFMAWDWSTPTGPDPRVGWQKPWEKSYIWALDKNTGHEQFKAMRGLSRIGHMTPAIVQVDGQTQLVSAAGDIVEGFNPDNGQRIWWAHTGGEAAVPSPVYGDGMVFVLSGFPTPINREEIHPAIRAFKLGGVGNVTKTNFVWEEKKSVPMLPSPVLVNHRLYSVKEDGVLLCINDADGKVIYRQRLEGTYSASPVFADGRIYFLSDDGDTTVVAPGPEFKQLAYNLLDEPAQASMAVSDRKLFIRTVGNLYCIASQKN